jgi:hypothetical protein
MELTVAASMVARRQNRAGGGETCARKGEGSGLLIAVDDNLARTKSIVVAAWRATCDLYDGARLVGRRQWSAQVGLLGLWMCGAWQRGIRCGRRCGAVGPVVAVMHRRLCPVGRRREPVRFKYVWQHLTKFFSNFCNRSDPR